MKFYWSLILISISAHWLHAQSVRDAWFIKTCDFVAPLEGEMYVSGTFGEPRPNHYHAGLDLKTAGSIGWKVKSVEDGYISRIKVSATGYGNALYIDHPCGLTTVYAHLDKFIPEVQEWVKNVQYQKQSFELDTIISSELFNFKRGEQIAFSGNTGGSAGPHLHFEVRETHSELVLNPMRFGFKVKDQTPPILGDIKVYPVQKSVYDTRGIPVTLKNISKGIYQGNTVQVPAGDVILAVHAFDRQDLTPEHKNGIPEIKMLVDDQLVFHRKMDTIDFGLTKYTHAMIDYCDKVKTGKDFYFATFLPGNQETKPYQNSPSNGRIALKEGEEKKVEIHLIDYHGNTSTASLKIKGMAALQDSMTYLSTLSSDGSKYLPGAILSWTKETFYDWIPDKVYLSKQSLSPYSSTYYIFKHELFPIHKGLQININEWNAPQHLREKLLVVGKNAKDRNRTFSTQLENHELIAQITEASEVFVTVDTTAPSIRWVNYSEKDQSFKGKSIQVKIDDNLSGIQSYAGYLNQKWILFEYDAKNNLLTHELDSNLKGEFELLLKVVDMKNNTSESVVKFKR